MMEPQPGESIQQRMREAARAMGHAAPAPLPPPPAAETSHVDSAIKHSRWPYHVAACVLLIAYWSMAVTASRQNSTGFDELAFITSGYSYWETGDFRLVPDQGPLPQLWATLPLRAHKPAFPTLEQPAWHHPVTNGVAYQFFYGLNNDVASMLFRGRAMIALFGACLGLIIYHWSASLFGPAGGLVSLTLYAFCPNMLAHGSLVTADMSAALGFTAAAYAMWRMLQRVTITSVLTSAAAVAVLTTVKLSSVLILPVAALMVAVRLTAPDPLPVGGRLVNGRLRQLLIFIATGLVHVAVVVFALWAIHGFRYSIMHDPVPGRDQLNEPWEVLLKDAGGLDVAVSFARAHHLLPEASLWGLMFLINRSSGRLSFLNGQFSYTGFRAFFPYVFMVKTPLAVFGTLILAAAGAIMTARSDAGSRTLRRIFRGLYRTAPLWIVLVVYWAAALRYTVNIGNRHILPVYPPVFVLAGAAAYWFRRRWRVAAAVVVAMLCLDAAESIQARPHYLSYFNPIDGGPRQAYRHVIDSSLDWGQDLPALKKWLDANAPPGDQRPPVFLSYFGTGHPDYYGIKAARLFMTEDDTYPRSMVDLTPGIYCISASNFWNPWTAGQEQVYQQALAALAALSQTANDPAARERLMRENPPAFWQQVTAAFDRLRFNRLCAYLRGRDPDDSAGYSILIFRLRDDEVRRAMFGPPPPFDPEIAPPPAK